MYIYVHYTRLCFDETEVNRFSYSNKSVAAVFHTHELPQYDLILSGKLIFDFTGIALFILIVVYVCIYSASLRHSAEK